MKNILVAGCSFTKYAYDGTDSFVPYENKSWPDYLDKSKYSVTNMAEGGAGYRRIGMSVFNELNYNPNKYDFVIVQWSNITRFDHIFNYDWVINLSDLDYVNWYNLYWNSDDSFGEQYDEKQVTIRHQYVDWRGWPMPEWRNNRKPKSISNYFHSIPFWEFKAEWEFQALTMMYSTIELLKNRNIPFIMFHGFIDIIEDELSLLSKQIYKNIDFSSFLWHEKPYPKMKEKTLREWSLKERGYPIEIAYISKKDEHPSNRVSKEFAKDIIEPTLKLHLNEN